MSSPFVPGFGVIPASLDQVRPLHVHVVEGSTRPPECAEAHDEDQFLLAGSYAAVSGSFGGEVMG